MQKAVILTEEEYNALVQKGKEVNSEEIKHLRACAYTLYAFQNPTHICPKCGKAMMVDGFVCPCCGYDDSDMENDED